MNPFQTIRGRLLVTIFFIHAVLMGLVAYDLVERQHRFMEKQLSQNGYSLSSLLASNAALALQNNDLSALADLLEDVRSLPDVSMIFVMDTTGRIRAAYPEEYLNQTLVDPVSESMARNLEKSGVEAYQQKHEGLIDTMQVVKLDGQVIGYCRIVMSDASMTRELKVLIQSGLVYVVLAIIIGVLLAWVVVRKMTFRITRLSEAATQIAQKNFEVTLPTEKGSDEIAIMEQGFRVMVDSIKTHVSNLAQMGKTRLLQSQRYQKALLEWAKLDYQDAKTAIRKATEIAADTLEIGRVSIWHITSDGAMLVCDDLYCKTEKEHTEGAVLHQEEFPHYFAALQRGEVIVANDAQNDPRTSDFTERYLKPQGISSMLDIPIIQEGKVVGVVCHEHLDTPKVWQPEEQDFAIAMGSTISLALEMERRKKVEERLAYRADHDELTELPNRRLLLDRLDQSIRHARRNDQNVAVLFIDLDHFKEINDSLGHLVGDYVLIHVARLIETQFRNVDTIARLGGDEFCLIIDSLEDIQKVSVVAEKLVEMLQHPICIDKHELYVTCSIGISIFPSDGDTPETLLRNADAAMYKAKNEGRNSYRFYTEDMTVRAYERVALEANLRRALEHQEFHVYYQPQVDGITGKLIGMEALIRWEHPELGMIPPVKFLPLAVETGLIIPIDRFVMRSAMTQLKAWVDAGLNPGILALNLTIKQLRQEDFIPMLRAMLHETGCVSEWIELEVTEGEIMENPEQAIKILQQISEMGITLAIDDFGTGYSSLAYLKRLPVDKLKIDRSFISNLPDDEEDIAIVQAIIALSKSLRLNLIAEGVETLEQKEFLTENGCPHIQGYLYGKPMKTEEMTVLLGEYSQKFSV